MELRATGPALAVAALLWAGPGVAGTVPTPECRRDLLVIGSELQQGQERLARTQDMPKREMCAVWRQHLDLVKRAGNVYRRCKTDTERRVMSGDMDTQAQDFSEAIASTCKGQ